MLQLWQWGWDDNYWSWDLLCVIDFSHVAISELCCSRYLIFKSPTLPDVDPNRVCDSQVLICPHPAWGICSKLKPQAATSYTFFLSIFAHMLDHHHPVWDQWFVIWSKMKQSWSWHLSQSLFVLPQICWNLGCATPSKMYHIYAQMCSAPEAHSHQPL